MTSRNLENIEYLEFLDAIFQSLNRVKILSVLRLMSQDKLIDVSI